LLSTYGIGKDKTADGWKILARSLLHQGLMDESTDGYRVLKLNKRSWEVLRKQRQVQIAVTPTQKAKSLTDINPSKVEVELLFERLYKLRKQLADIQSVPPYVIFADSSLKLMARNKPKTVEEFATISGVTDYKVTQYGEQFVSEVRAFCQEQKLPVPLPSDTHMKTLQLYQQDLSVEEIAARRGFTSRTIINHLSELIEMKQPIDLNRLVSLEKQQLIIQAIQTVGADSLKTIREHLGENYDYPEIQLVRAWWRRED
jgi:ATP-dependent DNA helicase RecQ